MSKKINDLIISLSEAHTTPQPMSIAEYEMSRIWEDPEIEEWYFGNVQRPYTTFPTETEEEVEEC